MSNVQFYIRTYGDQHYGMGHVYRSISLAKSIISKGFNCKFVIKTDESHTTSILSKSNLLFLRDDELGPLNRNFKNILIHDMPFCDEDILSKKEIFSKSVGLDYFFYKDRRIDLAINLFNHFDVPDRVFPVKEGIQYAIIRDDILNHPSTVKKSSSNAIRILVTFGSADPSNNTQRTIEFLSFLKSPISVILGPCYQFKTDLLQTINERNLSNIKLIDTTEKMAPHIAASDLVFCGGGTTLLETIFLRRPSVVLAQTKEEKNFAQHLEQQDLCYTLSDFSQFAVKTLLEKVTSNQGATENNFFKSHIGKGKDLIFNEILELANG